MVLPVVNAFALDAVPLKVPVIVPVEKSPLLSLFTIVLGVLVDVAESTFDTTVVIVDALTPPTLVTVEVNVPKPQNPNTKQSNLNYVKTWFRIDTSHLSVLCKTLRLHFF